MSDARRAAGDFGAWLRDARDVLGSSSAADVPCDGCDACCRSGYFIHIGPSESKTLAAVPPAFLAPAPGMEPGSMVMGFDQDGTCPMLGDDGCSIYADRPRTCRTYDCRVFAATGIDPSTEKPLVGAVAVRWVFGYPKERDRVEQRATQAAVDYLRRHGHGSARDAPSLDLTQLAMLATAVAHLFVDRDEQGFAVGVGEPTPDAFGATLEELGR